LLLLRTPVAQVFGAGLFGKLGALGYNAQSIADGGLNSPYDAKRVGDYTGLTPPFCNKDDCEGDD
jgi:hypothetical protein